MRRVRFCAKHIGMLIWTDCPQRGSGWVRTLYRDAHLRGSREVEKSSSVCWPGRIRDRYLDAKLALG